MIGIKLEGDDEFLDIDQNTAITVRLENPLLADADKISPGSYSFPFELPAGAASPKNAARLKNPHVIENREAFALQNATLFYGGLPFKKGTLKGSKQSNNRLSSNFLFGLSQISPDFKTAKLRDVISYEYVMSSSAITKKVYYKKLSGGDVRVVLNGKEYTDTNWVDLALQVQNDVFNETLDNADKWYPKIKQIVAVGSSPAGYLIDDFVVISLSQSYTVSPGVYAERDCEDPLIELSVKPNDDDLADYAGEAWVGDYFTEIQDFLAPFQTAPTDTRIQFQSCFNANLHSDVQKETDVVNLWSSAGYVLNDANWGVANGAMWKVKNYNSLQPFVRLKHVLDRIAEAFFFEWDGDFYNHADVQNAMLEHSITLDKPQNFIGSSKFIFWRRSFNINEFVPDITVVEFINALISRYNFAAYYSEQNLKVNLQLREPIAINQTYTDITNICSPAKSIEDNRLTGYTLRVEKEKYDDFSVEEKVTVGIQQRNIIVKVGRLHQSKSVFYDGGLVEGFYVSRPNKSEFSLRIFHDAGLVSNGSFDYPKGKIHGDTWQETISYLHENLWKYWLLFEKNRRTVNLDVNFAFRQLRNFNWATKYRFDRLNYLVKAIEVRLKTTGIEVSNVELYTQHG